MKGKKENTKIQPSFTQDWMASGEKLKYPHFPFPASQKVPSPIFSWLVSNVRTDKST